MKTCDCPDCLLAPLTHAEKQDEGFIGMDDMAEYARLHAEIKQELDGTEHGVLRRAT